MIFFQGGYPIGDKVFPENNLVSERYQSRSFFRAVPRGESIRKPYASECAVTTGNIRVFPSESDSSCVYPSGFRMCSVPFCIGTEVKCLNSYIGTYRKGSGQSIAGMSDSAMRLPILLRGTFYPRLNLSATRICTIGYVANGYPYACSLPFGMYLHIGFRGRLPRLLSPLRCCFSLHLHAFRCITMLEHVGVGRPALSKSQNSIETLERATV